MNELQIFNNSEFGEIRTVEIEGEPYFVGKDVAVILGYKDTADAIKRHVDDDDKLTRCFTDSGQNREMYIINESGLYSLVLSSKLPSAKRFKRWITSEVIPSIRKTGSYNKPMSQLELMQMSINQLVEQERQMKELSNRVDMIEAKSITSPIDYYTIAGFASIRRQKIDITLANILGRKASKLSREYGYNIGKVSDPRYGTVNTYHADILNKLFNEV